MRIARAIFFGVCALQASGCASLSRYGGYYSCDASPAIKETNFSGFADQIDKAIKPFGFRSVQVVGDPLDIRFIVDDSRNRVDLGISRDAFFISIKDYRNYEEADFVRAIKNAIEPHLDERCRGKVTFKRVADFLS
jgi:hypothetical protein